MSANETQENESKKEEKDDLLFPILQQARSSVYIRRFDMVGEKLGECERHTDPL